MFAYLKADLSRLSASGTVGLRTLIAGLLSQGFQAIVVYRLFNWLHRRGWSGQPFRFVLERLIEITCGISIPAACRIGPGLRIHHFGGIIFHPTATLGKNCTLYHGVTLGDRGGSGGAAQVGDNVLIGAGAKLIGEITVGDNVRIGANAVVTKDVPANAVVVGSPARILEDRAPAPEPEPVVPVRVIDFRGTYKGGGGPDKTVLNSAAQHDSARVDVQVVYIKQPNDDEFQIPTMASDLGIAYQDVVDRSAFDRRCFGELSALVKTYRTQVLHTHDDKTLLYGWALKLRHPALQLLHTCHSHADYGRETFDSTKAWWKWRLRKAFLIFLMKRHRKPILTVSENTRQRLIQGGIPAEHIHVMVNGIDIQRWLRSKAKPVLRQELGLADHQPLVGTVARITYDKDLPTFFSIADRVRQQIPEVKFVIVGDGYGNELAEAQRQVEEMGLSDTVHFTGHRSDLLDVYASFDLFLMTSRTEGMPNTVLEAMALETPVVSTNVGGLPELVEEGVCGRLCGKGDVDGLSAAVVELLSDPEMMTAYRREARARIERQFSFANRVLQLEAYYEAFADQRPVPQSPQAVAGQGASS